MIRKILCAMLALVVCMSAANALASTANASIIAPVTVKITAPFSGTLLPFDLSIGDSVSQGDLLFAFDTIPVYAPHDGIVSAVFAKAGDNATGVASQYGSLAVLEPQYPLYVAATIDEAYDKDENRFLHAGETLYLKSGATQTGTGLVTAVSANSYTVLIQSGDFGLGDDVRCYRESDMHAHSQTGSGIVARYPDATITASGRVAAVHVQSGDSVQTGDLLFELIDEQSAPGASPRITSPANGAVTTLSTLSGAQVYRGQLLCEIADLDALALSALVDEIDLSGIVVGDSLSYTLDAYPDETFTGEVTEIRPIGQARQNATYYDVRLTLPEGEKLLPGMNGTVQLGMDQEETIEAETQEE